MCGENMFQPIESKEQVYKKVMYQIQEMIMSGKLKKGDRLPPERQLSEMLNVGRSALKQAISALEVLGIVTCKQGDGNYITSDTIEIFSPLAIRFYLENGNENNILEFRYLMEVQLASLAAVKILPEQIVEFGKIVEEMKFITSIEDRQKYNNIFHLYIVNICDNMLITSIYESIMAIIADQISTTDGKNFYESHNLIYTAIKNGCPDEAAFYMATHFRNKFPNYLHYNKILKMSL